MARQRTFISLILVLITTFLVGCGGPTEAVAPPVYTPAQLEKIQKYATDIYAVRDRAAELQSLIENRDWIKVGNFIHGPMAEARYDMNYIVPNLLPSEQSKARQITRDLFNSLVKIDQAASDGNQRVALNSYDAAYASIEKFLDLLPELPQTPALESGEEG